MSKCTQLCLLARPCLEPLGNLQHHLRPVAGCEEREGKGREEIRFDKEGGKRKMAACPTVDHIQVRRALHFQTL